MFEKYKYDSVENTDDPEINLEILPQVQPSVSNFGAKTVTGIVLLIGVTTIATLSVTNNDITSVLSFGTAAHVPGIFTPTDYASPTTYPTEVSPTMYPTESVPTYSPTYRPTVNDSSPNVLNFTTYRDGYSYLTYWDPNPSAYLKYSILESHTGLIEPHADMYITVFEDDSDPNEYTYTYTLCDDKTGSCVVDVDVGVSFNEPCTAQNDTYTATIEQYLEGVATGNVGTGSFMCMAVRREFRALSEADLNATMNAMWEMWALDEDAGQELYGENFHNYARLLEYHYFNAAWQDADHIHEGNGFVAQHLKMDLIFQTSMQAINPAITLPYWDFTIENSTGIDIWDSPVFAENTFGSLNLPTDISTGWTYTSDSIEDGGIANGRWKNFPADKNTKYPDLYSAYGYMRAPWNMNPSNLITRFTSVDKWLPTCDSHYTLLSYDVLTDFLFQAPYGAHASAHGVIGGVYGCDLFDPLLDAGYIIDDTAKLNLCKNWIFYLKEFFRDNLIAPKTDCTAEDANGEFSSSYENQVCGYECVPEMVDILFMQLERSILNSDNECVDVENMPTAGWTAWKEFVCTGDGYKVFGGDHLESASPADPSFWPIHPTLERLLQARFMVGGFDTEEWPSDSVNDYVCNKATCYDIDEATTDDIRAPFGTWDNCCYGHYADDQLLDAPNGDRHTGIGPTNAEIFEWTNPTKSTYAMGYIYDSFTWSHCESAGYDFSGLLDSVYLSNITDIGENYTSANLNNDDDATASDKGWRF